MPRIRTDTEQSVASYPGARVRHNDVNTDNAVHQPLMFERGTSETGPSRRVGGNNGCVNFTESPEFSVELYTGKLGAEKDDELGIKQLDSSKDGEEEEEERAAWGGQLEFIFTCIGYAVGLGNVWRFPYLCYKNGGGAFLIPYIIMLAFVGLPLFFLELCFGQFASLGPISIWKINPLFKGLGMAMVSVSWLIAVYYNVVISHVMLFLFASIASVTSKLPWVDCDNWWNTDACLAHDYEKSAGSGEGMNGTFVNATMSVLTTTTAAAVQAVKNASIVYRTPSEEYYDHYVLEISSGIEEGGGLNWKLALCLLLSWIIVLICLIRGIASLGKVVYFTAIFPYVMLTILLIRGLTLPGAGQGIIFYLKPDFSRLADPRVWSDAATQIFYSLSACSGGLIAMASYNKFDNNCYRDSLIVALINCATSLYAGFVIFSILGFMAHEKGVDVGDVAEGGPGLAFVVYPEAISRMPVPQLWAILFFFMMANLGFGSQFSIVECVLSAITDEFYSVLKDKWASVIFRTCVIMFTYFMGLPMVSRGGIYLLDLVDYSVSGFPLLVVGLLEAAALAWIYGYDRLADDIYLMLGHRPNLYWKICWCVVTPGLIIITIFFNVIFYKPPSYGDHYSYPGWAQGLGWLIALFPISLIVGVFMFRFCRGGAFELTKELTKPLPEWGPYYRKHRTGDYNVDLTAQPLEFTDYTGRLYNPRTIMLARTPAGSSFNVTKVENYTGPVPVVLSVAKDKRRFLSPNILQRQLSQSMSDLEVPVGSTKGRTRIASGSVPHIPSAVQKTNSYANMASIADKTASGVLNSAEQLTAHVKNVGASNNGGVANNDGRSRSNSRTSNTSKGLLPGSTVKMTVGDSESHV